MSPAQDTNGLCLHSITTKPWPIQTAIDKYARAGVRGITVWREAMAGSSSSSIRKQIAEAGLHVVSLCRGGFFAHPDKVNRQAAIQDNIQAVDEAASLGAPLLVLVPGSSPLQSLAVSRSQIAEGIEAILARAVEAQVVLGIEPLHPMFAADRSAVNSLATANELCESFDSPFVKVVVDTYQLWWEPGLCDEIRRAGDNANIAAYHISDWKTPEGDILKDREVMGFGCIQFEPFESCLQQTQFKGFREVEILSKRYWEQDQDEYLASIIAAYDQYCQNCKLS